MKTSGFNEMRERINFMRERVAHIVNRFMPLTAGGTGVVPRGARPDFAATLDKNFLLAPPARSSKPFLPKSALLPMSPQAFSSMPTGMDIEGLIDLHARRHEVEPALVRALVRAESGFHPRAVSTAGAMGLMQLMPDTARALGVSDPFDPTQNIDGGVRYLKQMLERFGSVPLALAAYNAGPNAVVRYDGVPPFAETQRYVQRVLEFWQEERQRAVSAP